MKQSITILTCTAALFGAIAMAQVGTSVISHERESAAAADEPTPSVRRLQQSLSDHDHRFDRIAGRIAAREQQRPITPELIDQTLAVANEIDPDLGNRLKALCGDDPAEFERVLRTTGRRLVGMAELRSHAPELYDMKRREWQQEVLISRTLSELAEARDEDDSLRIRMLENELRTHISIQVALQIAVQGDYLRRLKEQMQALEVEIDRQARRFEQTVDERFRATLDQFDAALQQSGRPDIELIDLND